MKTKTIASVLTAVGLSLTLVACGADKGPATSPAAQPSNAASAPAQSSPPAESTAPAAGSGETSVKIDGKAVALKDTTVVCQEAAGTMNIVIGAAGSNDAVAVVLTTGDNPAVKSVGLGSKDGTAMGWAEGAPGNAKATKDGKSYAVSGKFMAVDMANPTAPSEKAFELKVTCP